MRIFLNYLLAISSFGIVLGGCSKKEKEIPLAKKEEVSTIEKRRKELVLGRFQIQQAGMTFAEASMQKITGKITGSAVIIPFADNEANLTAPVSGIIDRIVVNEGDQVRKGQALCYIRSIELESYKAQYFKAKGDYDLAKRTFARQKQLAEKNLISEQEYQESEAKFRTALAELKGIEGIVRSIGLNKDELNIDEKETEHYSAYALRAPISGTITVRNAVHGSQIDSATTLFRIVNLDKLWANVDVSSEDIDAVRKGGTAKVFFDNLEKKEVAGRVDQIGIELNQKTRTLPVKVVIDNPRHTLHPGMYGTAELYTEKNEIKLSVPNTALMEEHTNDMNKTHVFVRINDSTFVMQHVITGIHGSEYTEITDGLSSGDIVATNGLFILKSQVEKEKLQEDE